MNDYIVQGISGKVLSEHAVVAVDGLDVCDSWISLDPFGLFRPAARKGQRWRVISLGNGRLTYCLQKLNRLPPLPGSTLARIT